MSVDPTNIWESALIVLLLKIAGSPHLQLACNFSTESQNGIRSSILPNLFRLKSPSNPNTQTCL